MCHLWELRCAGHHLIIFLSPHVQSHRPSIFFIYLFTCLKPLMLMFNIFLSIFLGLNSERMQKREVKMFAWFVFGISVWFWFQKCVWKRQRTGLSHFHCTTACVQRNTLSCLPICALVYCNGQSTVELRQSRYRGSSPNL